MTAATYRGWLRAFLGIARSGAGAVLLHPVRSAVTVVCVVAIVLPYLVGTGISHGLRDEIGQAIRSGPDLHVTGLRFGRAAPISLSSAESIRAVPGVTGVLPRIVGEMHMGIRNESAVFVGLPASGLPESLTLEEGRLFADGAQGELVVGNELARRLGLRVGDMLPPFYRNDRGERISRVVGIFRSDAPLWQSHIVLVSLETAWTVFAEQDTVTEFLVRCPANFREPVALRIRGIGSLSGEGEPPVRPKVTTRDNLDALLLTRILDRETLFLLPFVIAFAVGVPIVLVTSGAGLVERRREAGLMRAMGWSQDSLILRTIVESGILAILGGSIAVLLAFLWLQILGGAGIAPVLLPGSDRSPGFRVPWQLGGVPVLLAFAVSVVLVSVGSLYSTWRAATAPAAEAMR